MITVIHIYLLKEIYIATEGAAATNTNKKVIIKNFAPFTNCLSKTNNSQTDDAEYIDIIMPMYNLIEYSDNYSKTSGSLMMEILLILMVLMVLIHLILNQQ